MTKPMMDVRDFVEKSADADLLREMIGFAAERLMELEVGGQYGKPRQGHIAAVLTGLKLPTSRAAN